MTIFSASLTSLLQRVMEGGGDKNYTSSLLPRAFKHQIVLMVIRDIAYKMHQISLLS
jgi:hypothetical protein